MLVLIDFVLVVIGGTVEKIDDVSGPFRALFRYEISVDSPNESQRLGTFKSILKEVPLSYDVSLKGFFGFFFVVLFCLCSVSYFYLVMKVELSMLTASLSIRDVQQTVMYAGMQALSRLWDLFDSHDSQTVSLLSELGLSMSSADFEMAINQLKGESSQSTIKVCLFVFVTLIFFLF
jgi:hypothetical protein